MIPIERGYEAGTGTIQENTNRQQNYFRKEKPKIYGTQKRINLMETPLRDIWKERRKNKM